MKYSDNHSATAVLQCSVFRCKPVLMVAFKQWPALALAHSLWRKLCQVKAPLFSTRVPLGLLNDIQWKVAPIQRTTSCIGLHWTRTWMKPTDSIVCLNLNSLCGFWLMNYRVCHSVQNYKSFVRECPDWGWEKETATRTQFAKNLLSYLKPGLQLQCHGQKEVCFRVFERRSIMFASASLEIDQ